MPAFEELQALSRFLDKNKVKNIQVIGNRDQPDTLFRRFYEGLAEGKLKSDPEARQALYGDAADNEAAYAKLKARLHTRMQNTLFFIDANAPGRSPVHKAMLACSRELVAVRILLSNHERRLAVIQAERTLKTALKFEFTDIALDLVRLLLKNCVHEGNKRKYNYLKNLIEELEAAYHAELYAEKCCTGILINYAKTNASKFELSHLVQKSEKTLRAHLSNFQSEKLILHAFLIFTLKHEVANDYEGLLKVSTEALELLGKKQGLVSNNAVFNFQLRKGVSLLMLRNFDLAEESLKKCRALVPKGSVNWYQAMFYSIQLCFHTGQYSKARSLFRKSYDNDKINQLPPQLIERWIILRAFLRYLENTGKLPAAGGVPVRPFRLSRFLNEVPVYSQDKRGANITILILQILFLLQQRKYGAIIGRTEALQMYTRRYLRRDDTFRSGCFIRMLLLLPGCNFNRRAMERHAQKYWRKLRSVPIERARQSAEIEIMPYEILWGYVLELLDEGFH